MGWSYGIYANGSRKPKGQRYRVNCFPSADAAPASKSPVNLPAPGEANQEETDEEGKDARARNHEHADP